MHYSKFLWDIINIQEAKSRIAKQLISGIIINIHSNKTLCKSPYDNSD